jgi:hypothetical protein
MSSTAHLEEKREPIHDPSREDGITINYWRMGQEGHLDSFSLLVCVQIAQHQVSWTMDMQPHTTQTITIDGRTIALIAGAWEIGIETRENGEHLGLMALIDNDRPLPI